MCNMHCACAVCSTLCAMSTPPTALVHFGHRRELDLPTLTCSRLFHCDALCSLWDATLMYSLMHCSLWDALLMNCVVHWSLGCFQLMLCNAIYILFIGNKSQEIFCCAFYVYYIPLKQSILVYQECNDESPPSAPLCQFVFIEIKALKPICRDLSNLSRLSALSSFSWFQRRVHNASHPALVCSGFTQQLDFHIGTVVCTVILGIRKVNDKIWVKSLDKKLKITRFIHVMTWPAGLITRI